MLTIYIYTYTYVRIMTRIMSYIHQGGHGTGKTGNLAVNFS